MDPQQKIQVLQSLNFIAILEAFSEFTLPALDIDTADDEDEKDKEQFVHLMAGAVNRLGVWGLDYHRDALRMLDNNKDMANALEEIFEKILQRAIALFDCERPRVVLPLCEFLLAYIKTYQKTKTVNDAYE